MKVIVYCQNYGSDVPQKVIWVGDMSAVPHVGSSVCLNQEWTLSVVNEVFFDLEKQEAWVRIGPDFENEFTEVPHD